MHNYFAIIRKWTVFAGCFLFLFSGCEKQADTPESKKVISKKIVISKTVGPVAEHHEKGKLPEEKPSGEVSAPGGQIAPAVTGEVGLAPPAPEEKASGIQAPTGKTTEAKKEAKTAEEAPAAQIAAKTAAAPTEAKQEQPSPGTPSVAISKKTGDMTYIYNPAGKIDPFSPIFKEKAESASASEKKEGKPARKPMTPLEKIDLSQLKLVAVMIAPSGNRALVEEASGKGYIITDGTFIGTNSGRVVNILLDKVVVEEEVEDILGNLTTKKTEMKLQKAPGE